MLRRLFALPLALVLCLPSCAGSPTLLGQPVAADTGLAYGWVAEAGAWALIAVDADGNQLAELDSGPFEQVLGPVPTAGGVAWARCLDGEWKLTQIGVSERVAQRSQGVADALAAAWALERVSNGFVPGNAADLAQLAPLAKTGAWPRPE